MIYNRHTLNEIIKKKVYENISDIKEFGWHYNPRKNRIEWWEIHNNIRELWGVIHLLCFWGLDDKKIKQLMKDFGSCRKPRD